MIFLLVSGIILMVVGTVAIIWSCIHCSKNYERMLLEESMIDAFEPRMVSLDDIPEENNTDDENIEEWAKKSKDEKYLEDISESMPEVYEKIEQQLSEGEIEYVMHDEKETFEYLNKHMQDNLFPLIEEDEIDFVEAAEDIPDNKFDDYIANYQYLDFCDPYLQTVMQYYAEQYDVPYSLVLALVETESSFREDIGTEKVLGGAEGGPRYYGYMQLSAQNCNAAANEGIDAHTPEGNIEWGCKLLRRYYDKYESWESAIMCYKHGEGGAEPFIKNGKVSTPCKNVMEKRSKWLDILYEYND